MVAGGALGVEGKGFWGKESPRVNEVIRFLRLEAGQSTVPSLWEVTFALCVTLLCSSFIAFVYRRTHRTVGYSQSYVQSLVLTSLVTSLIMIVIGSNLARAFSLIGALSIIRFRNAVKETRDVGFIFFSMAIAMAAGTGFFGIAFLGTIFISATLLLFDTFSFGEKPSVLERLLRVQLPADANPLESLQQTLQKHFQDYRLVAVETVEEGVRIEAVYSVVAGADFDPAKLVMELRDSPGIEVSYFLGEHQGAP